MIYSLSQVGSLPFHCPSAWHVLSAGPFNMYPVLHEYIAVSPKEVPALVLTWPLLGVESELQNTPMEEDSVIIEPQLTSCHMHTHTGAQSIVSS